MKSNSYTIAVLGAGNIGASVIDRLLDIDEDLIDMKVKKVLVADTSKERSFDSSLLTDRFEDIVQDESIQLVIEVLGGLEPGKDYIKQLLESGKSVITANKDIIADCGKELIEIAQKNNTCLYFEAAVAAGIPVLKPLIESLRGEEVTRVAGIINGTSNYILTSMEEGNTYNSALDNAKELGYAEPDPTNDVEGIDAKYKAMILSLLCFGVSPSADDVFTEGISNVTKEDFNARVYPVLVDTKHPLASIRGALNAVLVEGENINQLVFSGPGAGSAPTASAIIGDVLSACHQMSSGQTNWYPLRSPKGEIKSMDNVESSWFMRLSVKDEPGVLATIAGLLGDQNVSIESVIQEGRGDNAELVLVSHEAAEKNLRTAINEIANLDAVSSVTSTIRVYS
jgi:homoserine dehydrogenase